MLFVQVEITDFAAQQFYQFGAPAGSQAARDHPCTVIDTSVTQVSRAAISPSVSFFYSFNTSQAVYQGVTTAARLIPCDMWRVQGSFSNVNLTLVLCAVCCPSDG